jgi:hypothetical protein
MELEDVEEIEAAMAAETAAMAAAEEEDMAEATVVAQALRQSRSATSSR